MESLRWWYVSAWAAAIVLSVLGFLQGYPVWRPVGGLVASLVLALAWMLAGRRATQDRRGGIAVVAAVIILSGTATGFTSSMATMQCIAFPIVWIVLDRRRDAIVANVLLALTVGAGLYISNGRTPTALGAAIAIECLSLVFSIGLGLWITNISERSHERQRLIEQLEAAQAELSALSRDAGAAGERERLAREIHDTIAQDLTGLVLTAQRGRRELAAGNVAAAEKQLAILEENARNALTETRALVASGAAVGVDGVGLAAALRRLAERFERETGILVSVSAVDSAALGRDAEVVLLRCAQEALANVRKHSNAGTAALTLRAHDGTIDLRISDDGGGFDPARGSSGFGIAGLRERLALVRGTLDVVARPGGGTTLVATLPQTAEVG
jgi:signal transduction histidine kinase